MLLCHRYTLRVEREGNTPNLFTIVLHSCLFSRLDIRSVLSRDYLAGLAITLGEEMDITFETTRNGEEGWRRRLTSLENGLQDLLYLLPRWSLPGCSRSHFHHFLSLLSINT